MKTTTHETINHTTLDYWDNFAGKQFIEHLIHAHDITEANGAMFTARLLELVIEYGQEHRNNSKDQLAFYLYDVIPDVEFSEVVAYCSNDILTNNAKNEKYEYWDSKEGGTV